MSPNVPRTIRRLAYPRSRRNRLWACVYCGVFDDASADHDGAASRRPAE